MERDGTKMGQRLMIAPISDVIWRPERWKKKSTENYAKDHFNKKNYFRVR